MGRTKVVIRASVIVLLVASAFTISAGTLAAAEQISETNRSTLARITPNFGANYGVVDVSKKTGEEVPGIQSTTIELSLRDSSLVSMNDAINYVTQTLSNLKNKEVVNVFLNASSEDETQTFSYKFYGSSPDDLAEVDFMAGADVIKRMYADEVKDVSVVSRPALNGTRNVDTAVTFSSSFVDPLNLQNTWDRSVNAIKEDLPSNTDNLYFLSVANENDKGGPLLKVTGFYYDQATLDSLSNLDGKVWKSLSYYATDTELNSFPLKTVTYNHTLTGSNALTELLFEGDGAGLDNLSVREAFQGVSGKHPEILPYAYSAQLRYEAHADAFYTEYNN